MSRPLTILLAVLCAGAIVAAVLVVGPASSSSSVAAERTVTANKGVVQTTVSGSGNLVPAKEMNLDFGTAGTVTKISVKEGDKVTAGQMLARLDDADAQVTLDKAHASLESAEADLDAAESGQSTSSTGGSDSTVADETPAAAAASGGSTQTAAQKAAAIATAQANVAQAKLDVEDAERTLEDTVLRAPAAGTVTSLTGQVGDEVGASSASAGTQTGGTDTGDSSASSFITVSKLDRMQLEVSFTESDIGQVKVGQAATVSLSALTDVQLAGKVTKVAQVGTSSNGVVSYPVTIVLDQSARGVKAGMTASAEVIVKQASGVTLPSQAVTGRGTTGVVQVKQGGETVSKRVGIGLQGDTSTIITSGLEAGDEVVIRSAPAISGGGATAGQGGDSSSRFGGPGGGFPGGGGGFPGGGTFTPPSGGRFPGPGG
jgi:macrolide-specific efflux system membrane fusion protein